MDLVFFSSDFMSHHFNLIHNEFIFSVIALLHIYIYIFLFFFFTGLEVS